MDMNKLSKALHCQLDSLINDMVEADPKYGIVDLTFTVTSVDEQTEDITYVIVSAELVQLVDERWVLEEQVVKTERYNIHGLKYDEEK